MNIFKRELRANLKSLIIWSLSMIFLVYTSMLKYASFAKTGQNIDDLFKQFPSSIRSLFGIGEFDITTALGYYCMCYFYFLLLAGIHAVMLGCTIISKEERDKTADFLFTKPVLRSKIIIAKFASVIVNLIIFNLITLFSSIVFVSIYNKGKPITYEILKLMLALFFIQLIFASLGSFIASVVKNMNKATGLSTSILLATFMLSVSIDLYSKIEFLKYATPFRYFTAKDIVKHNGYDPKFVLLSFSLISIFIILTYLSINKRDIRT